MDRHPQTKRLFATVLVAFTFALAGCTQAASESTDNGSSYRGADSSSSDYSSYDDDSDDYSSYDDDSDDYSSYDEDSSYSTYDDYSDDYSSYEDDSSYGSGDLDCADIGRSVAISGSDPHGLDADGDGIGCEGW